MTRALAVWGTTSDAGKSLLVTGLARWCARQGLRAVPFKAQNMSNHARVVAGGEIGAAQWLQALAAGVTPDVRMNPVLTKPEGERRSQVVVLGRVDEELTSMWWPQRASHAWPRIVAALDDLAADADVVLVEGAGSPAETNLAAIDLANLATAAHLDASALLVTDIGRGGAFAHLYGTWALLPDEHRRRLSGFVLNRFRGDPALLHPAPDDLQRSTGVPTLGVLPEMQHGLPAEDGVSFRPAVHGGRPRVAVVRYPTASNLDELSAVCEVADVVVATEPGHLDGAELVVLPGSKHVTGDAAWLAASGLGRAVCEAARAGTRVLGICGGAQLLGETIIDVAGIEGPTGQSTMGLGRLDIRTELGREKVVGTTTICLPRQIDGPWSVLAGRSAPGYEIHHGRTAPDDGSMVWSDGSVLATTAHGLLEDPDVVEALLGRRPGGLEPTFDLLADAVDEHLDTDALRSLVGLGRPVPSSDPPTSGADRART